MAGIVHIPWYATLFRGDRIAASLEEIAPAALRYGALDWEVRRSAEDRYRFSQTATFSDHDDFYRYWDGPEFQAWRARHSSWYQVPILPEWYERLGRGQLEVDADELRHTGFHEPAGGAF